MAFAPRKILIPVDGLSPVLGPGQSRPLPDEKTRQYTVLVKRAGFTPMRWTIKAASPGKALLYASNRWPESKNEIIQ